MVSAPMEEVSGEEPFAAARRSPLGPRNLAGMIGEEPSKIRTHEAAERDFIVRALRAVDVTESDARDVADVLTAADLRGVESHGIARLDTFYVRRIEAGVVCARPTYTALRDRPTQLAMDAGNGLGHPAGIFAMRKVIEKARDRGLAFGTVRNSNHYGIAAYYAMLALSHGMIGLSMTNSTHLAVPTFGRQKTQGTNPIAVAIPAEGHPPFVLDMATTGVTFGRLEVSERKAKPLKPGWAVDAEGRETLDPTIAMTKGALLPLGGYGTENGGHKGYGLGALVEILCGVLSGGLFGTDLGLDERGLHGGTVGHFFGAFRIDALRDGEGFQRDLARELLAFEQSAPAPGAERVITPGEPERESTERYRREGVPIDPKVWENIDQMAERLAIEKLERFTVA
ncbi:MAG TPA: Ldh family oxidoreductase [Candidatus Limnocylindrales bacterium]|nr:Ldh family oxidoreductase [Candidatus Limnocylindrales bacterium]